MANPRLKRPLTTVNKPLMQTLLDASPYCGDYIEFGVWEGDSFSVIYEHAKRKWIKVHAVDTFAGMPESPIEADNVRWPKGSFDTEGPDAFKDKFPTAVVHEGVVPEILERISIDWLGFAHLDMDHEFSTKAALEWCWPRMVDKGILVVHDYNHEATCHAGKAVKDWMAETGLDYVGVSDNSIFFKKGVS